MDTEEATNKQDASAVARRWGQAIDRGFVTFPRLLLMQQHALGLDASEVVVLLNLIGSWWDEDDLPYPAVSTMATRMGVSLRTVQRSLGTLEAKGFLKRVRSVPGNGRASDLKVTRYDLAGTVQKLVIAAAAPTPPRRRPAKSRFYVGARVPADPVGMDSSVEVGEGHG